MVSLKLALLAALSSSVLATPVASSDGNSNLAKRTEGLYLVNCGNSYSVVVYCANYLSCSFTPSSQNQCRPSSGIQHWEGSSQKCTFPGSGTTFTWNIRADAQDPSVYARVGTGSNGFHPFSIFKEDKTALYTDGNGNRCNKIYNAYPN
ncbi:hypothetical protein ONS95_008445 [Cadophora gregata]|uniref:uncharacterized protein n=1 Tax=Cadophora gregata TaxID=51156 RepID=UPI0026DC6650|nr:uncharacterized protein ONS95_008445 [Cadophora gregata]KAK0100497.1 hypothetical protein ONS96_007771 [Cadophora gregata f. sp. sojae]KAK0126866.1 hypothetical protein ONS95_008445 [Cadophora gregata]